MTRCALIFGATGAVGAKLLDRCLDGDRYDQVVVIARSEPSTKHPKLTWITTPLEDLSQLPAIPDLNDGDAFCCLGTTIKAAGSKAAFRHVDIELVEAVAKCAQKSGVATFCLVSAVGASTKSSVFYNRVKGEAEEAVLAQSFPNLGIYRPSLLQGEREGIRVKEGLANVAATMLAPVFRLGFRRYQPIAIERLVATIYDSVGELRAHSSMRIFESEEIQVYKPTD